MSAAAETLSVTTVREAGAEDWPGIWPIVEEVVRTADTTGA